METCGSEFDQRKKIISMLRSIGASGQVIRPESRSRDTDHLSRCQIDNNRALVGNRKQVRKTTKENLEKTSSSSARRQLHFKMHCDSAGLNPQIS